MDFCTPIITIAGKDAGINVIFGQGTLKFNRVVIGDGKLSTDAIAAASDVASEVMDAELVGYESQGDSMLLRFTFNNKELEEGFKWSEYGVFAKYTPNDGTEPKTILYCYAYDTTESPESIPAFTGATSYYKAKFDLGVSVGNAEHVTVDLGDYTDFVAKEELQSHEANTSNPHGVTKEQVGLGSVENVSVNDARPTFTESASLSNIVSGETTSNLWGKVKNAISTLMSHLSARNPHSITPSKIGAAASTHNHSASEITSGVLSAARGGTGGNTGVINQNYSGTGTQLNAGKYRSVRTINLPAGTWVVNLIFFVGNYTNYGCDAEIFLTDIAYTGKNVDSISYDQGLHSRVHTDDDNTSEVASTMMIVESNGSNLYCTVQPTQNTTWSCYWRAVRII